MTKPTYATGETPQVGDIDVSAIKPGDFVTVRLEVSEGVDMDDEITVKHPQGGHSFIPVCLIIGHEPKAPEPLKVGDRVRRKSIASSTPRTIVAIDGDTAWVKRDGGIRGTYPLRLLERVS